jgi:hypothetical protein
MGAQFLDPDSRALRLRISETWTADEMASFLADLSHLYDIRRFLDMPPEQRTELSLGGGWSTWWVDSGLWPPLSERLLGPPLALKRIRHGSPGFVDVAGIGKAMEQLRLFLEFMFQRPEMKRRRKLEDQALAQDIIA